MSFLFSNTSSVSFTDNINPQIDVQERLRVSIPQQQWWYTPAIDADNNFRYTTANTGNNSGQLFIQNLAATELDGGTDANSSMIRVSRRHHKVRPGISHLWQSELNWDGADPNGNVTKRAGMYTNYNGIFFYVTNDLGVGIRRRLIDGTLYEVDIPRTSFSYDKLDGTGPTGYNFTANTIQNLSTYVSTSNVGIVVQNGAQANTNVYNVVFTTANNLVGVFNPGQKVFVRGITPNTYNGVAMVQSVYSNGQITLTYTKNPGVYSSGVATANLMHNQFMNEHDWFFDFNGGRSTRIRFGLNTVSGPTVVHIQDFSSANIGSPYESAPAFGERAEVINSGTVSYNPTMTIHGVTYNVEGVPETNPYFGVANSNTTVGAAFTAAGNTRPLVGVSLRNGEPYQRADLQITDVSIIDANNNFTAGYGGGPTGVLYGSATYQWQLVLNPTITNVPAPTNIGKASQVYTYNAASAWTANTGIPLTGGLMTSATSINIKEALNFINLGVNVNYTIADQLVLMVTMIDTGNQNGNVFATMSFVEDL